MLCIFAYVSGGELAFQKSIPLLVNGEFLKTRGLRNDIHVFLMKGAQLLSPAYRQTLEELGYRVHDAERATDRILSRFPDMSLLSDYLAFNYLRWVLAHELLLDGQIELPLIALDGDIVVTAEPSAIERDVAGRTFTLQGCPCFVAISDPEWLSIYERELLAFSKNPKPYDDEARGMLVKPTKEDREFCNARMYEVPLRHDQDLIEYLVAADRLPQARSSDIFNTSSFYWIQNPLTLGEWKDEQGVTTQQPRIVERGGWQMVAGKQIPFIHFQNDFAWYAHCWLRLSELGLGHLAPSLRYSRTGEQGWKGRALSGLIRRLDAGSKSYSRSGLCERSLVKNPASGNMYLTDIMNSCW